MPFIPRAASRQDNNWAEEETTSGTLLGIQRQSSHAPSQHPRLVEAHWSLLAAPEFLFLARLVTSTTADGTTPPWNSGGKGVNVSTNRAMR